MDEAKTAVKRTILRKLVSIGKIGGSHPALSSPYKGLPSHLTSNRKGAKTIKKAVKEMLNDGPLTSKVSTGELHISINPGKTREVKIFLGL